MQFFSMYMENDMDTEIAILFAFGGLQILFHNAHKMTGWLWVQKLSEQHWVVWVFHPTVLHTLQDYGVHAIIYSGYVIKGH